ncbi:four helix bundle protein [bacterium]|nr:four helix bundle protein [bacterium]NUN45426.1 four helix bundle protein [bacterium]HMV26252.1 four helix bundle protein [bacterium]HMW33296.1 four helix bundle protein [bacterium]HMW35799.1 four helix bundle protein [bacterium]
MNENGMLNLGHKNLDVWKLSIELVTKIYAITENFPKTEMYGITNQLRRAAVSVSSNIAEGAARRSQLERRRYYEIARSSLVEIDTQLEIALRLKFCIRENLHSISDLLNHVFASLSKLVKSTIHKTLTKN